MFVSSYFFVLAIVTAASCEEYNLYGEAGQAYALEIEVGHPQQKVFLFELHNYKYLK